MVSLRISRAHAPTDLNAVGELLRKYAALRGYDAALGDIEAEIKELPAPYHPPQGCLLLARHPSQRPLGCIAFKALNPLRCEMKRMFVMPDWRGQGIGRQLAEALVIEAKAAGYREIVLDSHPHMQAAQGLYASLGFQPIDRYNANPTPGIRFMGLRFYD